MTTEGPLDALVLAGGEGRRFGGGKLLAPWRGRPIIEWTLDSAFRAPVRGVILATGADASVAAAGRAFAARLGQRERLRLVHAADHAKGMSATWRAGLGAVPADAAGLFVFLGDMPRTPIDIPAMLAKAVAEGAPAAVPRFQGRLGHPVLFSRSLFEEIGRIQGDQGARSVLQALGERLALIETEDDGVIFDIDTPGDLLR
jgi:molybdenum cofactor cytidylyltransferase